MSVPGAGLGSPATGNTTGAESGMVSDSAGRHSSPPAASTAAQPEPLPDSAWIEHALENDPNGLEAVLLPLLESRVGAARLIEACPDTLLSRLAHYFRGADFSRLLPYAEAVTAANLGMGEAERRRRHWRFLLGTLFPKVRFASAAPFVSAYIDFLAADWPAPGDARQALRAYLESAAAPGMVTRHILFWLGGRGGASAPGAVPSAPPAPLAGRGIQVANAGQVLASPYLPRLFSMLGLLEQGRFIDGEHARRACHLLQFMVDERCAAPEHELALNKLLCGLELHEPLDAGIEIDERERSAIDGMLASMIAHWKALGGTSVAGLREAFLQRGGGLSRQDDAWRLKVEPKTIDVLMDRLPWGFSVIRHPWMAAPVMVEWR